MLYNIRHIQYFFWNNNCIKYTMYDVWTPCAWQLSPWHDACRVVCHMVCHAVRDHRNHNGCFDVNLLWVLTHACCHISGSMYLRQIMCLFYMYTTSQTALRTQVVAPFSAHSQSWHWRPHTKYCVPVQIHLQTNRLMSNTCCQATCQLYSELAWCLQQEELEALFVQLDKVKGRATSSLGKD